MNIKDKLKSVTQSAEEISKSTVVTLKNIGNKVADITGKTTSKVTDKAEEVIGNTKKRFENHDEKDQENKNVKKDRISISLQNIENPVILEFIYALGESKIELSKTNEQKIKKTFPIPNEQTVIWADAEFDLRPSGIAITDKGVFIKSDVSVFGKKKEKQKSQLLYFKWDTFNASWFVSESIDQNKALLVNEKCSVKFIETCRKISKYYPNENDESYQYSSFDENSEKAVSQVAPVAVAGVVSSESAVFVEQKAHINTRAGHGEMVEEAITSLDKLHGLDAAVVGRDNAKDGADRRVNKDIFIQTKYYNSARGSLEASFNHETGMYRYMNNGQPMQLEVPSDQYDKALELFKKKILDGKVKGVTDPNEANNIVRKGRLTYKQAVNLTKAGTIESLQYDVLTGAVTCSCVFGITFIATTFLTFRETKDIKEAISAGAMAGIKVFGISFAQHIVVSQIARTSLANTLIPPSRFVVEKLGTSTSTTIVNGIRALSGKSAIHGAAATKSLAKIMRSNIVTSAISFAIFSVPDTYNLVTQKISASQYAKNITVLAGGVVAGAGGAVAAGIVAAKIAGTTGVVAGPIGAAVGVAGGFIGGTVGAKAVDVVGDILSEDDIENTSRLFNAIITCMVSEYLLNAEEIDKLVKELDDIPQKELKALFAQLRKSGVQEQNTREFLFEYFDKITIEREQLPSLSDEDIETAFIQLDCEE